MCLALCGCLERVLGRLNSITCSRILLGIGHPKLGYRTIERTSLDTAHDIQKRTNLVTNLQGLMKEEGR